MFLLEPSYTPFDLNFRLFGIDVRVHPMFWLISIIMGFSLLTAGFAIFGIWIACVFFSILVHELGHVFMFRANGTNAHVVLYTFGGLAIPDHRLYNRWQRIAVSFAGPLAQFLLLGALAGILLVTGGNRVYLLLDSIFSLIGMQPGDVEIAETNRLVQMAISFLVWINVIWALLNLLPIYPLDGGQISRDFLDGVVPGGQGVRLALSISLVVAGVLTVHCIMAERGRPLIPFLGSIGGIYTAAMFGMLAVQSWQLLQQLSAPRWRREE